MEWINLIDQEQIVQWRRHIHQHPEVAYHEVETSKYIEEALMGMEGIEVVKPTPTSVLGILKGKRPGKTIGLRADIDALPIEEETDLPFKSVNPGVMHACGHDTHAAMLLGAASVLSKLGDQLNGTVKFIFQHAEELGPGGASQIIATGLLDDVDIFYGSHIYAQYPVGIVATAPGPCLAASDGFRINIQGRGAHGSTPQAAIDPVMVGAALVMNLNQIISRNVSPMDSAVLTVGRFTAGTRGNIIPDTAELEGTVRAYTHKDRDFIQGRIEEVTKGICGAHGAEVAINYRRGYGPVVNDPACVEIAKRAADKAVGKGAFMPMPKQMGSEDFSAYLAKAPGVYVIIAGGSAEDGCCYGNHHPKFVIDERALSIGARMYVGFALEAMNEGQ